MTSRTLIIAGWLSMISAFITLPLVYMSYKLDGKIDVISTAIQTVISVAGTILFVLIILYLKKFINSFFKFHNVDRNIYLMIVANVSVGVISIATLYVSHLKESAAYAIFAVIIAQGIVQVQFGYKLIKLPNDLGGLLKPFCYTNIATGLLMVSIVLIPFGIVVSAVSDLMLGTIFLNMGKLIRNYESRKV